MSILIFGRNGQLARDLSLALGARGHCLGRAQCDITSAQALASAFDSANPTVVVNAAAYTEVDKAESDRDAAHAINGVAPGLLAKECAQRGVPFVHVSTDYVFDGLKETPWTERDAPAPLSVYGHSKLAGEQAVEAAGGAYVTLRTSWIYGPHGKNFFLTMLRLARAAPELRIVADQWGAPTSSHALAQAIVRLCDVLVAGGPAFQRNVSGLYHLAASGETSWHGFAQTIVEGLRARETVPCLAVTAITTLEYPTPARRPFNSRLDSTLFRRTFLFGLEDWRAGLNDAWERLDAAQAAPP